MLRPAVFLDRDGVIIRDVHLLTRPDQIELEPTAPLAMARLQAAGFALVVVTNQPVVARGLIVEADVLRIHAHLASLLKRRGAEVDGFYFCPHHPRADLPSYRLACDCRKPRPGLILRAARELGLDVDRSTLVGDRPSDIVAGRRAGCRAILVQTGSHMAPPIEPPDATEAFEAAPEFVCRDLGEAAEWILGGRT